MLNQIVAITKALIAKRALPFCVCRRAMSLATAPCTSQAMVNDATVLNNYNKWHPDARLRAITGSSSNRISSVARFRAAACGGSVCNGKRNHPNMKQHIKIKTTILPLLIALGCFALFPKVHAVTSTVINTDDSGAGSLRQALVD